MDGRRCSPLIADAPASGGPAIWRTMFGRERAPFKLDVRKLKNLGLTLSFEIGYRVSPRGEAYLRATNARPLASLRSRTRAPG